MDSGQRPGEDQLEAGGWRIGTSKQTFGSTSTGHGTNIQPVAQLSVQPVVQRVVSSIHTYSHFIPRGDTGPKSDREAGRWRIVMNKQTFGSSKQRSWVDGQRPETGKDQYEKGGLI